MSVAFVVISKVEPFAPSDPLAAAASPLAPSAIPRARTFASSR